MHLLFLHVHCSHTDVHRRRRSREEFGLVAAAKGFVLYRLLQSFYDYIYTDAQEKPDLAYSAGPCVEIWAPVCIFW